MYVRASTCVRMRMRVSVCLRVYACMFCTKRACAVSDCPPNHLLYPYPYPHTHSLCRRLAEEEMQSNIREAERFELPSGDVIETIDPSSEDLQVVQLRIRDNLNTLAKFAELRDPTRSRAEYLKLLRKDLAFVYGYSDFLMGKLMYVYLILFSVFCCLFFCFVRADDGTSWWRRL